MWARIFPEYRTIPPGSASLVVFINHSLCSEEVMYATFTFASWTKQANKETPSYSFPIWLEWRNIKAVLNIGALLVEKKVSIPES